MHGVPGKNKDAIDEDVYQTIEDLHIRVMANPRALVWWNMLGKSLVQDDLETVIDKKLQRWAGTDEVQPLPGIITIRKIGRTNCTNDLVAT